MLYIWYMLHKYFWRFLTKLKVCRISDVAILPDSNSCWFYFEQNLNCRHGRVLQFLPDSMNVWPKMSSEFSRNWFGLISDTFVWIITKILDSSVTEIVGFNEPESMHQRHQLVSNSQDVGSVKTLSALNTKAKPLASGEETRRGRADRHSHQGLSVKKPFLNSHLFKQRFWAFPSERYIHRFIMAQSCLIIIMYKALQHSSAAAIITKVFVMMMQMEFKYYDQM